MRCKYPYGPRLMLIGHFSGFVAGSYSLLFGLADKRPVTTWEGFILGMVWYLLIGIMTLSNAWGMLYQAEIIDNDCKKNNF